MTQRSSERGGFCQRISIEKISKYLIYRTPREGLKRTRAKRTGEANPFWAFSARKDWE